MSRRGPVSVDGELLRGNSKGKEFPTKLLGTINKEGRPGWSRLEESQSTDRRFVAQSDCARA